MDKAKDIKLVILDVDGVMTDGRIVIDDNGVESRNFDIKDGMGVVVLMMSGVEVAIITSKKSGAVRHRAEELKIKRFHEGIKKRPNPTRKCSRKWASPTPRWPMSATTWSTCR
jgi:3-deoxy-D-manno-octulosonate 8-phosphate phosphatase (KDO 8-P phosphatase)